MEPHFIIPESLVAFCAVVFARIANEQTNKQTNELNYINYIQITESECGDNCVLVIQEHAHSHGQSCSIHTETL